MLGLGEVLCATNTIDDTCTALALFCFQQHSRQSRAAPLASVEGRMEMHFMASVELGCLCVNIHIRRESKGCGWCSSAVVLGTVQAEEKVDA